MHIDSRMCTAELMYCSILPFSETRNVTVVTVFQVTPP